MRILTFGASGMIGPGVLQECLLAQDVSAVDVVAREELSFHHQKLTQCVLTDVANLSTLQTELQHIDACFFSLGTSSFRKTVAEYTRVTFDLTLRVARALAEA